MGGEGAWEGRVHGRGGCMGEEGAWERRVHGRGGCMGEEGVLRLVRGKAAKAYLLMKEFIKQLITKKEDLCKKMACKRLQFKGQRQKD